MISDESQSGCGLVPKARIFDDGKLSGSRGGFQIKCRARGKCKDLFESWDAMTYHARTQKQNEFECLFCKKTVTGKQSLQRHINAVHTHHAKFKCPYPACARSFNRKCNLKRHINGIHTKLKAYDCTKCAAKFYYRHLFTNHLANVHAEGNAPQKHKDSVKCSTKAKPRYTDRTFECYFCRKTLPEKRSLRAHMKALHTHRNQNIHGDGATKAPLKPKNSAKCFAEATSKPSLTGMEPSDLEL